MSNLLSKITMSAPVCIAMLFLFIAAFGIYRLISKNQKTFWTALLFIVIAGILCYGASKYALPRLLNNHSKDETKLKIYDTDARNNEFIIASLSAKELRLLDKVLMIEKKECGLRLSNQQLNELTHYDNNVITAYNRWRKCKEMRRSYHHVIYPDERKLYLKSNQ